jgi:hypothetical protein
MTTSAARNAEYALPNAWEKARERMEAENGFLDPCSGDYYHKS